MLTLPAAWYSVRFMKYYPLTVEEERKTLKAHTDFSTITILWSQPTAALHILPPDGMEFLSGSFYKATIHHTVHRLMDECGHTCIGAFYFAIVDDNVVLLPLAEGPVLQRIAIVGRFEDEDAPTTEQWRRAQTNTHG